MRSFTVALVALILFAANANAQCQCSTGGACICTPGGCGCTQHISAAGEEVITDGWHPLIGFPGQHTLYKDSKCLGVMCEGKFYTRISKGVFADAASTPPVPFPLASRPVMQFAPAIFMGGGCAAGNCGR